GAGGAGGQRGEREEDAAGDQAAAEGDEGVLGGGECRGGAPVACGGALGALGGAAEPDARGDGEGPADRLGLGPTGMLGGVESAGRGGRRIGATIKEETL